MSDKTRVLILGGGFGGLYAALEFEKRKDPRFEVTVVNRENFFLFTPMLHEIAASDLDLTNIVNPVRKMIRHVFFGPADTAVMGSSLGGVVSFYLAWQWPDVFGKIACLSSTFTATIYWSGFRQNRNGKSGSILIAAGQATITKPPAA